MKKIFLIIIFLFMFISTGCESFSHIDDLNGENDYSLNTINEERMLNQNGGLAFVSIITSSNKGGSVSIEKFSGVKKLNTLTKNEKITISFSLLSGNANVYLCTKNEIIHTFNINESNQEYIVNSKEKLYLKMACESAKINIDYTIE